MGHDNQGRLGVYQGVYYKIIVVFSVLILNWSRSSKTSAGRVGGPGGDWAGLG